MASANDESFAYLRVQAGNRVQRAETLPDLNTVEIRGLYHELQIHQVELQLQNDQLRESQWRLEQTLQKYRELFTSMPVGFATINSSGRVVDCNPAGLDLLKLKPGTSFTFTQFLAIDDADRFALLCRNVLSTKVPRQCELTLVRSDHSHSLVTINCFPVTSSDEQRLGITFQDITAQIEAEKTLRSNQAELQLLTRRLFAAHEEERHNIAGHLNDDYAQRVIRMMVEMHVLEKRLKQDHEARDLVARLKTGLKVLVDDMRFMAHTLEPLNLTVAPLSRSIRDYIEEFRRQTDLRIRFRIDNAVDQLPHECGVHLYRMLQESLSNVVRHADATTLDISFSKVGTAIEMTIADNGKGFDLNSALQERKGMGLIGMQERVRQMAGRIAIESSSSKGTSIQISIATDASACSRD